MNNSTNQVGIDLFSSKYQEEIVNLIIKIQQTEFKINITAKDQPDLYNIPDFYQKDKGNFWVAVLNGEVVGTISLLDIENDRVALRKMFVKNEYRGEKYKVAELLLKNLLKWALLKEIKNIYLGTTPDFLAAHKFYEKNGFIEIEKSSLPDTFPVMKVDSKFYKFDL